MNINNKKQTKKSNKEHIIDLSFALLSIASTSNNSKGLHEALSIAGKELEDFTIEPFLNNNIPSLLVHNTKQGTKKFRILLSAHLDTVPGNDSQFDPYIKNGNIYGRGAYDMKAAAAVMILVFKNIAQKVSYPIALNIVTDEETGGYNGIKILVDKGIRADFSITGECGSNFNIVYRAKGITRIKLVAKGVSSHSAYPWRGENAILKLNTALLNIAQQYPTPKREVFQTTVNVTNISNNNTDVHTVTPDHCEAILDIRYISTDEKDLIPNIEKCLPKGVTYEVIFNEPMVDTDPADPHISLLQEITEKIYTEQIEYKSAHATSDLRHLAMVGVPAIEFGPVGGSQHHDDEWVNIESLYQYYNILKTFLESIETMKFDKKSRSSIASKKIKKRKNILIDDLSKKKELLTLTSDLVRISSVWNDLSHALTIIDLVKEQLPNIDSESYIANNFPEILFSNRKHNKKFKVLLNAHLDVMKGTKEQFSPREKNGKLYGKGVFDSKASAAAMVLVYKELVDKVPYPLGLQLITDGTSSFQQSIIKQIDNGLHSEFVISGEGSDFNIVHGIKGKLMISISNKKTKTDGQEGMIEMYELVQILSQLYPAPKQPTEETTLSILKIETNANGTTMSIDIRHHNDSSDNILKQVKALLSQNMLLEIICDVTPNLIDETNPYVKKLISSAESVMHKKFSLKETYGSSEANYYSQRGINAVEFSPAGYSPGHIDYQDEWVEKESIYQYYQVLKDFLLSIK